MRRHERQVYSYDMAIIRRAQLAPFPPLSEIVVVWEAMFRAGATAHARERGNIVYRIGDIDVDHDRQVARLLIRRGDINASNPFFSHRVTGQTRAIQRDAEEDGERAAHLVVSLAPEAARPNIYLCQLEGVTSISHAQVQALLNAILKKAISDGSAEFAYADPGGARRRNGDPKTTPFVPGIELTGHPSSALISDLEQGAFKGMTLIDRRPHNQLGGNQYLTEKERFLVVSAAPNMPSAGRFDSIIAAARAKRGDFQTARLRFVDPEGNPHAIDYDIASGTPEQQAYVQSYWVRNINPPMDDSSLTLVPFLANRMADRVVADRT